MELTNLKYEPEKECNQIQQKSIDKKKNRYIQLKNSSIMILEFNLVSKQKQKKSKEDIKKMNLLAQFQLTAQQKKKYNQPSPTIESLKSSIASIGIGLDKKRKDNQQKKLHQQKIIRRIKKKPCARDGHSCNIYKNYLYLFGGDRHTMGFNDLYYLDLNVLFNQQQ